MACVKFTLVAATIRTSVFSTLEEPTLMNSPLSSTRNKRAWVGKGNSPTSSRKIVPPLASPKYPFRSPIAPVNAPFSWPNSSESIVPSGMAPQFTAMYCPCLRRLYWCIICGKLSFPTPLSPVISTDKSVGATWIAISMARISASLLPMMPKRNFTCCISAFVILQIFFYTIEFQFVAIVTFLVILLAQRICMCLFLTLAVTEHIYCHIDSLPE